MAAITINRGTKHAVNISFSGLKATAGTIGALKCIKITDIDSNKILLIEAVSSAETKRIRGITVEAISDAEDGLVVLAGFIKDVDTSGWAQDADLYADPSTAGDLTTTVPDGLQYNVEPVASVVKSHATDGILEVYNAGVQVHANRGGGSLHEVASDTAAGFLPQSKMDATVAPTVDNDTTEGYEVGSRWADVTADKEYVCLDATDGVAVWTETTGSAGGSGNLDGGVPSTNYGGITAVDGGAP